MFRNDIKINESTNLSRLISSPPQAESTHIEHGSKSSGKLTPKRRAISPLQNSKGITKISNSSPVLSRKIDPQIYTDVQSRGLTSRIVKYHELSKQNERPVIRSNYTKPGEFPIVNLNTKKELPYVVKRNLSSKNPPVRIAPPDKSTTNLNYRSSMLRSSGILIKNDPLVPTTACDETNIRTRSVLDELTEISRKRINNEELKIDSIKKTCIEGTGTSDQSDGGCIGLGGVGIGGNKKRQRDTSFSTSPTSISPTKMDNLHLNKKNCLLNTKPSMIKNNDILSSLSSSMIFPNAKLNRNVKSIVSHPNSYNTNNVFIQSIERQYHSRLPSFDAQPACANKMNLMYASSAPEVQTAYATSTASAGNISNLIATRSEPHKPASQKLLLFNRPEVPNQQTVKLNPVSEDSAVNFVKPKQIIDNNLIIEPNKINENSLVKRKSNLTGIERSKLAMMLEYLKSDDEDDEDRPADEVDNKTDSTNKPIDVPVISNLSSLPITTSWITTTTPQTTVSSVLPTISSESSINSGISTATVTNVSVSPVMTSKIATSAINVTQNSPTTSVFKPIVTPNTSTVESKPEVVSTVAQSLPRLGGFSFPINTSTPSTSKAESTAPLISSSTDATPTFTFEAKTNPIEKPVSFLPNVSAAEKEPQASQTFSFFNKPNASVATIKLPPSQPDLPSINFSSHQPILPASLINFSSPQKNPPAITKPSCEEIYTTLGSSQSRNVLNVPFGGVAIPTTNVNAASTIIPVTTAASKFSFTNNSNAAVNTNFPESTTAANMFTFNPNSYKASNFNSMSKPIPQTTMSVGIPVTTATTESSLAFMQNTSVPTPSVSVVKPFSLSSSNVTTTSLVTETPMFNSGNDQSKSMFDNFPAATTTTASNFTFGNNVTPATQQNNVFGNTQAISSQQNNVFANSEMQSNNVFGNPQVATTSSNNSETTLFNFKTSTANNTTNQILSNADTSSDVFKMRSTGTTNSGSFGGQPASNVFGGGGIQQKSDIFGGGMGNISAKPSSVFNFSTPTTSKANHTSSSTFSFVGVNKNQPTATTNIFAPSNTEPPKQFNFGGGSSLNKIQAPSVFGSNNDTTKNFAFGQNAAVINPPPFGSNMFNSNSDGAKLESSKAAFGFGSPNSISTNSPSHGMFSFSNNTNVGPSNNNISAPTPTPVFGQVSAQATVQNPFSIGPGANASRRPVKTAIRRLNKQTPI